eukprot:augustus_masked-scaffold_23-processed-gene-5.61-mRNA-1 protein AED:1.00 eAED:1.00 QI:0/-1/0/0/-1/1/1/0/1858
MSSKTKNDAEDPEKRENSSDESENSEEEINENEYQKDGFVVSDNEDSDDSDEEAAPQKSDGGSDADSTGAPKKKKKKRKRLRRGRKKALDEDDLMLIQENQAELEGTAVYEDDREQEKKRTDYDLKEGYESEESIDSDGMKDFIVDRDDTYGEERPRKRKKQKHVNLFMGYQEEDELERNNEYEELFGYDKEEIENLFMEDLDENYVPPEEREDDDQIGEEVLKKRFSREKSKPKKRGVFEHEELAKRYLLEGDDLIRKKDIPERFQVEEKRIQNMNRKIWLTRDEFNNGEHFIRFSSFEDEQLKALNEIKISDMIRKQRQQQAKFLLQKLEREYPLKREIDSVLRGAACDDIKEVMYSIQVEMDEPQFIFAYCKQKFQNLMRYLNGFREENMSQWEELNVLFDLNQNKYDYAIYLEEKDQYQILLKECLPDNEINLMDFQLLFPSVGKDLLDEDVDFSSLDEAKFQNLINTLKEEQRKELKVDLSDIEMAMANEKEKNPAKFLAANAWGSDIDNLLSEQKVPLKAVLKYIKFKFGKDPRFRPSKGKTEDDERSKSDSDDLFGDDDDKKQEDKKRNPSFRITKRNRASTGYLTQKFPHLRPLMNAIINTMRFTKLFSLLAKTAPTLAHDDTFADFIEIALERDSFVKMPSDLIEQASLTYMIKATLNKTRIDDESFAGLYTLKRIIPEVLATELSRVPTLKLFLEALIMRDLRISTSVKPISNSIGHISPEFFPLLSLTEKPLKNFSGESLALLVDGVKKEFFGITFHLEEILNSVRALLASQILKDCGDKNLRDFDDATENFDFSNTKPENTVDLLLNLKFQVIKIFCSSKLPAIVKKVARSLIKKRGESFVLKDVSTTIFSCCKSTLKFPLNTLMTQEVRTEISANKEDNTLLIFSLHLSANKYSFQQFQQFRAMKINQQRKRPGKASSFRNGRYSDVSVGVFLDGNGKELKTVYLPSLSDMEELKKLVEKELEENAPHFVVVNSDITNKGKHFFGHLTDLSLEKFSDQSKEQTNPRPEDEAYDFEHNEKKIFVPVVLDKLMYQINSLQHAHTAGEPYEKNKHLAIGQGEKVLTPFRSFFSLWRDTTRQHATFNSKQITDFPLLSVQLTRNLRSMNSTKIIEHINRCLLAFVAINGICLSDVLAELKNGEEEAKNMYRTLLTFIPGFGPRKAASFLSDMEKRSEEINSRSELSELLAKQEVDSDSSSSKRPSRMTQDLYWLYKEARAVDKELDNDLVHDLIREDGGKEGELSVVARNAIGFLYFSVKSSKEEGEPSGLKTDVQLLDQTRVHPMHYAQVQQCCKDMLGEQNDESNNSTPLLALRKASLEEVTDTILSTPTFIENEQGNRMNQFMKPHKLCSFDFLREELRDEFGDWQISKIPDFNEFLLVQLVQEVRYPYLQAAYEPFIALQKTPKGDEFFLENDVFTPSSALLHGKYTETVGEVLEFMHNRVMLRVAGMKAALSVDDLPKPEIVERDYQGNIYRYVQQLNRRQNDRNISQEETLELFCKTELVPPVIKGMEISVFISKIEISKGSLKLDCSMWREDVMTKLAHELHKQDEFFNHEQFLDLLQKKQLEGDEGQNEVADGFIKSIYEHSSFLQVDRSTSEGQELFARKHKSLGNGDFFFIKSSKAESFSLYWRLVIGKENNLLVELENTSNGKMLRVRDKLYSDLDEIISNHIFVINDFFEEILSYGESNPTHFLRKENRDLRAVEDALRKEKEKNPMRVPYLITPEPKDFVDSRDRSGRAVVMLFCFLPHKRAQVKHIPFVVTDQGFHVYGLGKRKAKAIKKVDELVAFFKKEIPKMMKPSRSYGGQSGRYDRSYGSNQGTGYGYRDNQGYSDRYHQQNYNYNRVGR